MARPSSVEPFDFTRLLAPLSPEAFFATHWEKNPLHVRRHHADHYASVLTNDDLEGIISSADLRYPAIQLARHGGYFPPEAYTRTVKHGTESFAGVPDLEKVRSEYRSGATIVLPALHRTWGPLRELCAGLERFFSHAVHANAYLTAGNTTGFSPHYDTHEVFVLQVGGKKTWQVYEPPVVLPHRSQPFARTGYVTPPPLLDVELHPGDLLYLPRGYVHSAATTESHAAHVTLGVTVYTWVELLSEWALTSKDLPAFREALPVGFANRDDARDALRAGLLARILELTEAIDADQVIDTIQHRVRGAQPRPPVSFRADVKVISPHTELRVPEAARYVVGAEQGNTTLTFDGRTLMLPAAIRPTLDAIGARASFRVEELPRTLEIAAMLAFVQYLEGEGFLTLVPDRRG